MRTPPLNVLFLLVAFALAWVGEARSESEFSGLSLDPTSGITIRITNYYDSAPPFGTLPIRVEIRNDSARPHAWSLTVKQMSGKGISTQFVRKLDVPAGSGKTFEVLVPILSTDEAYSHTYLYGTIEGFGVIDGARINTSQDGQSLGEHPSPFLGMGKQLSVKNWGSLKEEMSQSNLTLNGTSLNMAFFPQDWSALAGFSVIVLTGEEWHSLDQGARRAALDWVAQGGRLIFWATGEVDDHPVAQGLGAIEYWKPGDDLLPRLKDVLSSSLTSASTVRVEKIEPAWFSTHRLGPIKAYPLFLGIFVLGFAVVIGPVNFLWLAPVGRRHRLFATIPAISLGASVVIVLFALITEGVNGRGQYYSALMSFPSRGEAVRWQDQVSHTGVLTSSQFTPSEPSLMRYTLYQSDGMRGLSGYFFSQKEQILGGDWFRSRSIQGQELAAIVPSRDHVEISQVNGQLQAVSTFPCSLENLFYFDDQGRVWQGAHFVPGAAQVLHPSDEAAFRSWQEQALRASGEMIRTKTAAFAGTPRAGHFFADGRGLPPIQTLNSIHWTEAGVMLFGEVLKP